MSERRSTGFRNALGTAGAGNYPDILANGVIGVFTGTQPTDADQTEAGSTLLGYMTKDAQPFIPGQPTNGLNFEAATNGIMSKSSTETWQMVVLVDGYAGWFRHYDNDRVTGASTTAKRLDGAISTGSSTEITMASTRLKAGETVTLDSYQIAL